MLSVTKVIFIAITKILSIKVHISKITKAKITKIITITTSIIVLT